MKTSSLFSVLTFLLLVSLVSSDLCNPADKKALFKIKHFLNNPYHLASWQHDTDCCHWYCVKCDRITHRINVLTISYGNISGHIPPSVGDLPFLEHLEIRKLTNLTGPIQPTIAKLTNLKYLYLSWTNLSGPIPAFLGTLKTLAFLDLSFNDLSGTIPPSLSQLPNLDGLRLDRNKLTGPIPDSFGSFAGEKPPWLHLSHNQLSGKIPTSMGNIDFSVIDLSRNRLEGDASMLFGANKTTMWVFLDRNLLEFDISKVGFAKSLTQLELSHNKIYGSLPVGLMALDGLGVFNASYNRLCGKIPVGGQLQNFDEYSYFHNRCLCGAPLGSCK